VRLNLTARFEKVIKLLKSSNPFWAQNHRGLNRFKFKSIIISNTKQKNDFNLILKFMQNKFWFEGPPKPEESVIFSLSNSIDLLSKNLEFQP
jgi:hypothetical protein